MRARVQKLIDAHGLEPHPEGGRYRRVITSPNRINTAAGTRPVVTSIYYLLVEHEISRPHRIKSDEVWHLLEGGPLLLSMATADYNDASQVILGRPEEDHRSVLVPGGYWQGAAALGPYAFLACTVAPGFDFEDFEFADVKARQELANHCPGFAGLEIIPEPNP